MAVPVYKKLSEDEQLDVKHDSDAQHIPINKMLYLNSNEFTNIISNYKIIMLINFLQLDDLKFEFCLFFYYLSFILLLDIYNKFLLHSILALVFLQEIYDASNIFYC